MPAIDFQLSRDRDAWATIRGFGYQIALTVERWLMLSSTDVLEIERGEDIDICERALAADADGRRILEQVKRLEGNVTLRTPAVVEFLASAYEHLTANPGLPLIFRFVSTAGPGIERPSPLVPRRAAIDAWRDTAQRRNPESEKDTVTGIGLILKGASRPPELAEETWTSFSGFLTNASVSELGLFMSQVEWAIGQGDGEVVRKRVQENLVAQHQVPPDSAESAYRALFFFVFEFLSQRGLKRLTRADVQREIASGRQSNASEKTLASFAYVMNSMEAQLEDVESRLSATEVSIDALLQRDGLPGKVTRRVTSLGVVAPPPVPRLVEREAVVAQFASRFRECSLLALRAEPGFGKTQLARLLVLPMPMVWVRLRRSSSDVDRIIADAKEYAVANEKSVVVLDNIGSIGSDDAAIDELLSAIDGAIRFVTTSVFTLPGRLLLDLGSAAQQHDVPAFSLDEAKSMMAAYRSPPEFQEGARLEFLHSLTAGHPSLLRAVAAFLEQRSWSYDIKTLQGLVGGQYAQQVKTDAQGLFRDTVEDLSARELIYRLDAAWSNVSRGEVEVIAAVPPPIAMPFEKLDALKGIWAQQLALDQWRTSPLIAGVGRQQLAAELVRSLDLALAEFLTRGREVDSYQVERALVHLVAAESFDRAASLHAIAVQSFLRDAGGGRAPAFLRLFPSQTPANATEYSRALVLYSGMRLSDSQGFDDTKAMAGIRAILANPNIRVENAAELAYVAVAVGAGPLRQATDRVTAIDFTRLALRLLAESALPEARTLLDRLNGVIWLALVGSRSPDDLTAWAGLLRTRSSADLNASFKERPLAYEMVDLGPKIVVLAVQQQGQDSAWGKLYDSLLVLEESAASIGLNYVAAVACAAQVFAHAQQEDLPAGLEVRVHGPWASNDGADCLLSDA